MSRCFLVLLACMPIASAVAQTARHDTIDINTAVNVGYSASKIGTLAGAVDKVTQERMNKGMVISSLDALS